MHLCGFLHPCNASLVVKNLPASEGDTGSIPGSGRSPGEGNGKPLQYSCLGNPMDRGAWQATVHGFAKSQTKLGDQATTTGLLYSRARPQVFPLLVNIT